MAAKTTGPTITTPDNVPNAAASSEPTVQLQATQRDTWNKPTTAGGDQVTIDAEGVCTVTARLGLAMCAVVDEMTKAPLYLPLTGEDNRIMREWAAARDGVPLEAVDRGPLCRVSCPQLAGDETTVRLEDGAYKVKFDLHGRAVVPRVVYDKLATVFGGDGTANNRDYEIFFDGEVEADSPAAKAAREEKERIEAEAADAAAARAKADDGGVPEEDDGENIPDGTDRSAAADLMAAFNAEDPGTPVAAPTFDAPAAVVADAAATADQDAADGEGDGEGEDAADGDQAAGAGAGAGADATAETAEAKPARKRAASRSSKSTTDGQAAA